MNESNLFKFSIITVVKNRSRMISKAIESVKKQTFKNFQYIVIDGDSNDGTKEIINANSEFIDIILSEKDRGIYDALNKGIALAKGEFIGFLHSDDYYANNQVLYKINKKINELTLDAIYGDANYIDSNKSNKVVRRYSSKYFSPKYLEIGLMPAHETLFVKKKIYDKIGLFNINFKIAGDFEWIVRAFYKRNMKYFYFPEVLINMNIRGVSTANLHNKLLIHKEIKKACDINNIPTNWFKLLLRYFFKLREYIQY